MHIKPEFGNLYVEDINSALIESFLIPLLESPTPESKSERKGALSGNTINKIHSLLSKIFKRAIKQGYININPMRNVDRMSYQSKEVGVFTHEEEDRLIAAAKNISLEAELMILIGIEGGLRASEILGLDWKNITLEGKPNIHVMQTVVTGILKRKTKTNNVRNVPIPDKLYKALVEYKANSTGVDLLFINPNTNKPYYQIQGIFDKVRSLSGVHSKGFHSTRHTFVTRAIATGERLDVVQKWAGHTQITTTMKYNHLA